MWWRAETAVVVRSPRGTVSRIVTVAAVIMTAVIQSVVHAQGRTDVVALANGDRITGEIVRLDRGRLEFKTDDAGTLFLEWDKLTSLVSTRRVELITADGRTFLGSLARTTDRSIDVVGQDGSVSILMKDVTLIAPIGQSFWKKLDGSIDAGFSYTKSSGVAQLNLNTETVYRKPGSQSRVTASFTQTETDDGSDGDDRGAVEVSHLRYPWQRWFVIVMGRLETNESLGLELRSQIGGAGGPRLVSSNRAQLVVGGGLVVNDERGVDVAPVQSLEALLLFRTAYFTYDRPKTNVDITSRYYPSLSDLGRHRLQLDASVKREFWKDLFLSLSMYDSFDSRPPNPGADRNDVGVVVSVGWTY